MILGSKDVRQSWGKESKKSDNRLGNKWLVKLLPIFVGKIILIFDDIRFHAVIENTHKHVKIFSKLTNLR